MDQAWFGHAENEAEQAYQQARHARQKWNAREARVAYEQAEREADNAEEEAEQAYQQVRKKWEQQEQTYQQAQKMLGGALSQETWETYLQTPGQQEMWEMVVEAERTWVKLERQAWIQKGKARQVRHLAWEEHQAALVLVQPQLP